MNEQPKQPAGIVCTITVTRPRVLGRPYTCITVGRADKPHESIIDWPNITALRHNFPKLAARLESGWKTQVLTLDDLAAVMKVSTFNAWAEPPAPANPSPHYIDFLMPPKFMRNHRRDGE